jgi:hypothetical protein
MDSRQRSNTPDVIANGTIFNRRSLLKSSATFAASAVVTTTFGLLDRTAQAEQPTPSTASLIHPWEDFPGGL